MRALLVGGTGFISSLLARRLWADGHDVTVVARGLHDSILPRDVERLAADRCQPGELDRVLAGRSFDVVYDFVAYQGNAARQLYALLPDRRRMGHYVLVSTVAVYAPPLQVPIREDLPLGSADGHVRGKLDAEAAAAECARRSGIPVTIVRPNETLGPRDGAGRRFLHLVQRAWQGQPITVPGRLSNRVNWIYVEDLARLLALAAVRPPGNSVRVLNAAGGAVFTLADYVSAIFGALGQCVPVRCLGLTAAQYQAWEGRDDVEWHLNCFDDSIVDVTRARDELGFVPSVGIAEAVRRTVRWLSAERPDLLSAPPPDAERARRWEQGPALTLEPTVLEGEDDPDDGPSIVGDRLGTPLVAPPAGPGDAAADRLGTLEIATLLPLSREPDALDRASLLGEVGRIARATGADDGATRGELLERADVALDRLCEAQLVRPLEREGMPAYRIAASGYLALLAAGARPPRDAGSPAAVLVRFHALARTAYLGWVAAERPASEVLDPYALGIPFDLPDRAGLDALPPELVEAFGGFEGFVRYFHEACDAQAALARWKGALRRDRARLEEERDDLSRESARLGRDARTLLADEGTRSELVQEVQLASAPDAPVEVLWVKRAELTRRTLHEPRIALLDGLLGALDRLGTLLAFAPPPPLARPLPPPRPPREGELAPDFAAPGTASALVRLSQHRGTWVVLYFYPADDTPGCTLEACRFRDEHSRLVAAGSVVLGVSTNDLAAHRVFRSKHGVPFELVSDGDARISRAFGVFDERCRWAERVTFLVDPAGRIARIFRVQGIADHPAEVLSALQELSSK